MSRSVYLPNCCSCKVIEFLYDDTVRDVKRTLLRSVGDYCNFLVIVTTENVEVAEMLLKACLIKQARIKLSYHDPINYYFIAKFRKIKSYTAVSDFWR